ncbi:MAG: hypothetical protein NTX27_03220 [Verrucomicrobia bacterium]|nr:hypothetical protein [Verrucomicrobiota bacterium]
MLTPRWFFLAVSLLLANSVCAQPHQRVWSVPRSGTFWSMQLTNHPPLPHLPPFLQGAPLYQVSTNSVYAYDDRTVDYVALNELVQAMNSVSYPPIPGGESYGDPDTNPYLPGPLVNDWAPGDLWLEIEHTSYDPTKVDLILHGTTNNAYYQYASTTDLSVPFGVPLWVPGEVLPGLEDTNTLYFTAVETIPPVRFFRAAKGDTKITMSRGTYDADAKEPCSMGDPREAGAINLRIEPTVDRELAIRYLISGSAQNGIDYTNLSGSLVVPPNTGFMTIYVHPCYDSDLEFEESVTLTLILTNGYLVDPLGASATSYIRDCTTNLFTVVATNIPSPAGIDYHPPTSSLLLSVNSVVGGAPGRFVRLGSDGSSHAWSTVTGLDDEVKFAIPRTTADGWTNGSVYFGSGVAIGCLSSNGSVASLNWSTLTNSIVTNALYLRGSLCFDQTGVWSNHLIAVTSKSDGDDTTKGIWRIDPQGRPTLVANLRTKHLEGVTTITNDAARWGPWAGKILTGDETVSQPYWVPHGIIYATDTNGVTTSHALGIHPEDFDIVPPDQSLYCLNYDGSASKILKLSKSLLTNYVGDLLITQAGESHVEAKLYFVHWTGTNFMTRSISLPTSVFSGQFEHVTFAPIELPNLPQ